MSTSGQEAGRPQPTTTVEAAGGPFIRHSQPGRAPQYVVSGSAFGSIIKAHKSGRQVRSGDRQETRRQREVEEKREGRRWLA